MNKNKFFSIKLIACLLLVACTAIFMTSCHPLAFLLFGKGPNGSLKDDTDGVTEAVPDGSEADPEPTESADEPDTTPAATTKAPDTTPAATTKAPETTPAVTTKAPETTPAVTTKAPETTPAATTKAPETTPAVTTKAPETTPAATTPPPEPEEGYVDAVPVVPTVPEEEKEELLPSLEPAQITLLKPVASGKLTESNEYAVIDYSNAKDGYVMVKYKENTSERLRVQVIGPTTTYTYTVKFDSWEVFPLSDGNGAYTVKVFKNVVDNKYSLKLTLSLSVSLSDEFAPFVRPNQYVNYENADATMNKAASLVAGKGALLDKVEAIYRYVVTTLSYDYDKAATVSSGYLPDLDAVLASKKGICFDYAALMTGMLRSQNIPCKLVVGYANETYHAWINVWSEKTGWIDGVIFFDGVSWQRMDPTFASTAGGTTPGGINYTSKYFY